MHSFRPNEERKSNPIGSGNGTPIRRLLAVGGVILLLAGTASADLLLEEGFNYPPGTGLAANPPWSGNPGPAITVAAGNLSLPLYRGTVPAGNEVQISGGTGLAFQNFTTNPVSGDAVYCSFLFRCTALPARSELILALMPSGNTSPNPPDDPLDFYVVNVTNGCTFRVGHTGDDPATVRSIFATNVTHLIVLKYTFGSGGEASIYVDPVPGAPEPSRPSARTSNDDDGIDAASLQMILLDVNSGSGSFLLDTLRVTIDWADADLAPVTLSLAGPYDQANCLGGDAVFNVTANGTPPYAYLWRTNGVPIPSATKAFFTIAQPTPATGLAGCDVVVSDAFGSITSRVAGVTFSTNPPVIIAGPANQLVVPGVTNALFQVLAAGDAPVTYQWLSNGTNIPDATNAAWLVSNPQPADASNTLTVVVSNPCGSVTSSPPASVQFPTLFYAGYDAGPGFFGGENVIFTNVSGLSLYAWSSPDLSVAVTNWNLEGPLSETPLGTSGLSRYGINLNPATSPEYYVFSDRNTGPYMPTETVVWLTTPDFAVFTLTETNWTIGADGIFVVAETTMATNTFFAATDAGAGFVGGENLVVSAPSGLMIQVWSSSDPSIPVAQWNLEGLMNEMPWGGTGDSLYGLNLNPATSPEYYIFAQTKSGPYSPTEPLVWLTTADFSSFTAITTNAALNAAGVFALPALPEITQFPTGQSVLAGQNAVLTVAAIGTGLGYVWNFKGVPLTNATAPALALNQLIAGQSGIYIVTITNSAGSAVSAGAQLTVVPPPSLVLEAGAAGALQMSGLSVPGVTYVVQVATNLANPVWYPVATNLTDASGMISFQPGPAGNVPQYFRLAFP